MVHLSQTSNINAQSQPLAHQWDSLVRKHYNKYQQLIDSQTYQLQRTQRLPFSLEYPRFYNSDLIFLNLLKRKQAVGQVTQQQVNIYKNINPQISCNFNRTFNNNWHLPKFGLFIGGGLFAYASLFNFSIPTRAVLLVAPIALDYLRISSDPIVESKTSQFLDWVIGYRKAKCWAEKNRHTFATPETKKVLGENSLNDLGRQLISLAQGQK